MNTDNLLAGMIALDLGLVTPVQLKECVRLQSGRLDPEPIGQLLLNRGYLTTNQLDRLLAEQKRRMAEFSDLRLFGQVALDKGFVSEQQLGECIREQLRCTGGTKPFLGQVMIKKGYLNLRQFAEVITTQGKTPFLCSSCDVVQVLSANTSLADATCRKCGRILQLVNDTTEIPGEGRPQGDTTVHIKVPLANLGKFEIQGEIARGAMGIVFKAYDAMLDRTVALKVLKEGDTDEAFLKRLHREGAIAAKLHHPNIVTVYEVGQSRGLHYLCMDFIPGVDLIQYVRRGGLDRKAALRLLETVARAIHYAHAQGVIHRDLKPSNILVKADGTPVITDFGLAKSLDTSLDMTKEGTSLGTPHYMPPEQVLGAVGKIDPRSDVYSLGAVMYEILVGRPPFSARTTMDLYQKVLSEEPERPSLKDKTIELDLEAIVLKALEKDRDFRYFSAEDLAIDLGRYVSGEAVLATRATPARLLGRKLRKYRGRLVALAAGAVLAVAATFAAFDTSRGTRIRRLESEAIALRAEGRWEDARARYEQILALQPNRARALEGWAECRERIAAARERELKEAESKGQTEAAREREARMAAARSHYDLGMRKFYDAVTLMREPGFDLKDLERWYAEAIEDFTRAVERAPDFSDAFFHRARCYLHIGKEPRAEADLTETIRLSPTNGAAYYERGKLRFVRFFVGATPLPGARKEAAEDFRNALYHAPNSPPRDGQFAAAGFLYLADGQLTDAVVHFCRAVGSNRVNADAHLGRGLAHLLMGDPELAVRSLSEALRLQPNLTAAAALRGAARAAARDADRARAEYASFAARTPQPMLLRAWSALEFSQDRFEEAWKLVDQAFALDPDDALTRLQRGRIFVVLKRRAEAAEELAIAIKLDARLKDLAESLLAGMKE